MARSWPGVAWIRDLGRRWSRLWRGEYEADDASIGPFLGHEPAPSLFAAPAPRLHRSTCASGAEHRSGSLNRRSSTPQLGDLTSLTEAKRSGDPFTLKDSLDPPSLGLEPADSQLKLVGQPQIASLTQFAPVLGRPTVALENQDRECLG